MRENDLHIRLRKPEGIFAPLVVNPLTAKLAEDAGFNTGYLGGGAVGLLNCGTEANLSLTTMAQIGLEIRAQSRLNLILDGTCGWGDPAHLHSTMRFAEAVGFAAIEIEDQVLPKRFHHHIGVEHIIPQNLAVAKIREAAAARNDKRTLIVARTNAVKVEGIDAALRRGDAFHQVGADLLLFMTNDPEQLRTISQRMPHPLAFIVPLGGLPAVSIALPDLIRLGFSLIIDAGTALFAMTHALRRSYEAARALSEDPTVGNRAHEEEDYILKVIGLDKLIEIERQTTER